MLRGGLSGRRQNANGQIRRSTTRPINGIDQVVGINRALWTLAEGMQRLKTGLYAAGAILRGGPKSPAALWRAARPSVIQEIDHPRRVIQTSR